MKAKHIFLVRAECVHCLLAWLRYKESMDISLLFSVLTPLVFFQIRFHTAKHAKISKAIAQQASATNKICKINEIEIY